MVIDAIRGDPAWNGGDYDTPPAQGLFAANYAVWMMTSSPLRLHKANPTMTREQSDALADQLGIEQAGQTLSAAFRNED